MSNTDANTAPKRIKPPQQDGVLVLHKPSGPTSTACLERIKRVLGQKKIGHAGTLDPLADGVLVVLLGQATKLAPYLTEGEKVYKGSLELGKATDTYDSQGQIVSTADWSQITEAEARAAVMAWLEDTSQIVPPYSAAKHKGKALYALSREGKEVPEKRKEITISGVEVVSIDLPRIDFRVRCGAGTYIRSLVHSLGMRLSCGAFMTALTREHSHPFDIAEAHTLDAVLDEPEALAERVLSMARSLPHWPRHTLSEHDAALVKNGAQLDCGPEAEEADALGRIMFLSPQGEALALAQKKERGGAMVWALLRGLWRS